MITAVVDYGYMDIYYTIFCSFVSHSYPRSNANFILYSYFQCWWLNSRSHAEKASTLNIEIHPGPIEWILNMWLLHLKNKKKV